jgi:gas vesicle protein
MSYAGPASRGRGSAPDPSRTASIHARAPQAAGDADADAEDGHETDWQQVAIFGAGVALGLALGAGAALLAAPQSGEETRAALKGRVRRIKRTTTRRGMDAWGELGDELRAASRALRRRRAKRSADRALRQELERETARELASD